MRVLVTGGTGFIGRRLMEQLIQRFGAQAITCLVHTSRTPAEAQAVAMLESAGVRMIQGDLNASPISVSAPPAVDVVFHLAANIDTDTPEPEHRINDTGTERLLDWLAPISRGCRIMYTSSVGVMDRAGIADGPLNEDSPCTPRTAYGLTKLRGEHILRERAERDGFTWTILRLPTVYGPGQKPGGLFDLMIGGARTGAIISRLNWPGRTSVIFVEDLVACLVDMSLSPEAANQLYCVSSGEDLTLADIARESAALLERPWTPIRLPPFLWNAARRLLWLGLVRRSVPAKLQVSYWRVTLVVDDGFWFDSRKFLSQVKRPLTDIREGLRRTIASRG
jgi:nucleoside-diphosphate-sugar epimerase